MLRRRGGGLLVQSNRRRTADEPAGGAHAADDDEPRTLAYIDLPEHEPLQIPLSDEALRVAAEFSNRTSATRKYEEQLKKSMELLREAVGSINDASTERAAQVRDTAEKRQQQGREQPTRAEEDMQKMAARLAEAVGPLTLTLERAARETIDRQMGLQDERDALVWTATQLEVRRDDDRARARERDKAREIRKIARRARRAAAAAAKDEDGEEEANEDEGDGRSSRKRRKRASAAGKAGEGGGGENEVENDENDDDDDDDDGEDEEGLAGPPTSALELLQQKRAERKAEYARMSAHEKYGLNNDYVSFKRFWHDAKYPSGDVQLPDASAWFDAQGEPVPYGPDAVLGGDRRGAADDADAAADGGGDDSGDDIVIAREVISFNCPLTLVPMKDPYTSRVCKHTFEKAAILEYLSYGSAKCPQTGCNRDMSRNDLMPDKVMRRKIERAALQAQRQNDMELDEGDEGDDDMDNMSMVEGPTRTVNVKREMRSQNRGEEMEVEEGV